MGHYPSHESLKRTGKILLIACMVIYIGSYLLSKRIVILYSDQKSPLIQDRDGRELLIRPNMKGQYMRATESLPQQWSKLLLAKEDRFFLYHAGINPVSIMRNVFGFVSSGRFEGSSTLTQQLVKTLIQIPHISAAGRRA